MQRLEALKYELMPDGQQKRQMRRFAGSCRFTCEVNGATRSSAGTHRSDSGAAQCPA
ncbi:MAG: helix-turn-helix domain-containing protein [Halomonadaceae bacterium]|nr:helix-turn-helix domain-containing protein [Halomonadaceae bacterium]